MERAIKHYIKKESGRLNDSEDKGEINKTFDRIGSEIDKVGKRETKKARRKKLKELKMKHIIKKFRKILQKQKLMQEKMMRDTGLKFSRKERNMKNLKHIQIELEENRAEIKSIDEHEWSDEDLHNAEIYEGDVYISGISMDDYGNERNCGFQLNDEDLAVLVSLKGFDLVKRGDTNE